MENNTGFTYRNEKGEFLLRIINRGHFDEDHYVLKFVTAFEWGCLFYSEIVLDENDRDSLTKIKYRTLFSREVIADCACEKVVVNGDAYNGFRLEVVSDFSEWYISDDAPEQPSLPDAYRAGQQSQQAKIDCMQVRLNGANERALSILNHKNVMVDKMQAKIDEL